MSKHVWASPNFPIWYVLDRLEERMKAALGNEWTQKDVYINCLSFVDQHGKRYPMSKQYQNEKMAGGTLWHLLREARSDGVHSVAISFDVHIMDVL